MKVSFPSALIALQAAALLVGGVLGLALPPFAQLNAAASSEPPSLFHGLLRWPHSTTATSSSTTSTTATTSGSGTVKNAYLSCADGQSAQCAGLGIFCNPAGHLDGAAEDTWCRTSCRCVRGSRDL